MNAPNPPKRKPVRDRYDAIVDYEKTSNTTPETAYGLVKFTYDLGPAACSLAQAEPLFHDLRDPNLEPRLCAGSDFWPYKTATDVVVTGSAWHRGGVAMPWRNIILNVAKRTKVIRVTGRRTVTLGPNGNPVFGSPELFTELEVINANAYGGWDARVPMQPSTDLTDILIRQYDHPGVYPRNPFGKGYVVVPQLPDNEVELPHLEDPQDPLTPERFFVRDPKLWFRQPLPWCFDWTGPLMYHRYAYLGEDAWFPAPDDERMPEVKRGMLPPKYRELFRDFKRTMVVPPPYFQESSLGMALTGLTPGTPFSVVGMNPEHETLSFLLPPPPKLEFSLEQKWEPVLPRLHSVLVLPGRRKLQLVYGATYSPLPRKYVPGVHAKIPLCMRVDGDSPILYEVPKTIGETYRESRKTPPGA